MQSDRIYQALQYPARQLGLSPTAERVRPQFHLHLYDCLPSTSTHLRQLAQTGAPAGTVVIAQQQQAGRGQWGRQWTSPPGGLYLSLLLEPDVPLQQGQILTLASAWGIVDNLQRLGVPARLKWPNDLVLAGYKLGGLLTEMPLTSNHLQQAIVGVGVNWSNPVPTTGIALRPWLQAHRPQSLSPLIESLEQLGAIVLRGILHGYYTWQQTGTQAFLLAYQQQLINMGQQLTINGHSGQIIGVSETGALRVRLAAPSASSPAQELEVQPGTVRLGYNA